MSVKSASTKRSTAASVQAGEATIINSSSGLAVTGNKIQPGTNIGLGVVTSGEVSTITPMSSAPVISNLYIADSSYNITDDTAFDPAGGYARIVGSNFKSGIAAYINGVSLTTTFVSSTQLNVVVPASATGSYSLMVFNPDGAGGIYLGLNVSNLPSFITAAGSLGSLYETNPISTSISATGDAPITYSLYSGTLPTGATLASNGTLSGTSPVDNSSTTYTFIVKATDAQNQDSFRSFSLTINTDTVTWTNPPADTSATLVGGSAMTPIALAATSAAGKTVSYTANTLPTGVTLSGGTLSGTATIAGTTTTTLTATAATTNRTATRTISWIVTLGDTYWKDTTLLLNGTTPTPSFVSDASSVNNQVTVIGDTKPNSFNPYQEGYYSNYFDNSSYATIPVTPLGAGNWTIEGWVRLEGGIDWNGGIFHLSDNGYLPSNGSGVAFATYNSLWHTYSGGSNFAQPNTPVPKMFAWTHFALVKNNSVFTLYIDGVACQTGADTTNYTATYLALGGYYSTGYKNKFSLSNFRIVKGTAVYTANFTPSTQALTAIAGTTLLCANSSRLIDTSPYNCKITPVSSVPVTSSVPFARPTSIAYNTQYSTYFDGTGDYLTVPSTGITIGTGDFTVEGWFYFTGVDGTRYDLFANISGFLLYRYSDNNLSFYTDASGTNKITVSGFTSANYGNKWTHIAITRQGGNTKLFLNGTQAGSTFTSDTTNYTGSTLYLGRNGSSAIYYRGYISNFRVVTGTALYTTTFTPSTAPLTAVSGTSLLTCQNSTLKDNSTNAFVVTSYGDAQPTAFSPFTQTTSTNTLTSIGSAYFDGSGDFLKIADETRSTSALFALTDKNFTYECWIYPINYPGGNEGALFNQWYGIGGQSIFTLQSSGYLNYTWDQNGNGGVSFTGTSQQVKLNMWNHVALVRNNGTFTLYVNGIADATTYNIGTQAIDYYGDYIKQPSIAARAGYGSAGSFNAYISDFRLVIGSAVYTSNFLPPQTPLTAVTNTKLLTLQYNGNSTNNNFVDQSSANNIVTRSGNPTQGTFSPFSQNGWSTYFDGGSQLTFPSSTQYAFGTGAFTFEGWVKLPKGTNNKQITVQGSQFLLGTGGYSGSTVGCLRYYSGPASTTHVTGASYLIATDTWTHFAVVRENTSANGFKMYVNGTLAYVSTDTGNYGTSATVSVGSGGGNDYITGNISNFRILKGTALYTTASTTVGTQVFTPSTVPLTAITNTQLLTCQSNRLIDNSPNTFAATVSGTPSVQAYSPFGGKTVTPTAYSAYMDGNGYVISPAAGSANVSPVFGLGKSDYTVETWLRLDNDSNVGIWDFRPSGTNPAVPNLLYNGTYNQVTFNIGSTTKILYTISLAQYTWYHLAVVRIAGVTTLYVDGVARGTYTGSEDFGSTSTLTVGTVGDSPGYSSTELLGSISNLRVVRGVGVYTGAFTVPASPLQVSQSSGTNIAAVGTIPTNGNSVYFNNSTSDYLTATGSNLALGTGDFTIECWFYRIQTGRDDGIYTAGRSPDAAGGFGIKVSSTNQIYWNTNTSYGGGTATVVSNQWNHLAVVRVSGVLKWYLNGVLDYTNNSFTQNCSNPTAKIGITDDPTYTNMYISNFRIIKGTGLYTTNFTPSTAPLTAVANTVLLTCQSADLKDNSTNGYQITKSGSATIAKSWSPFGYNTSYLGFQSADAKDISVNRINQVTTGNVYPRTTNPFGSSGVTITENVVCSPEITGGSMYFDGNGDYLSMPSSSELIIGQNSATVEFWIYPTSVSGYQRIVTATTGGFSAGTFCIRFNNGSLLAGDAGGNWVSSNTLPVLNAWNHIAWVGTSGSTQVLYINGVNAGTSTTYNLTTAIQWVGGYYTSGPAEFTNGYLSDVRITKGATLYTSNFAPPAAPVTAIATVNTTTYPSSLYLTGTSGGIIDAHGTIDLETVGDTKLWPQDPYAGNYYSNFSDGNGDYLTVPSASWTTLSGTFTVEFWANWAVTPQAGSLMGVQSNGGFALYNDGTRISPNLYGSSNIFNSTFLVSSIVLGQWYHIAITRDSSNLMTMWVNGVSVGSTTTATTYTQGAWAIFSPGNVNATHGYISNHRVANTCLYTTTFTPSTSPLTAVSGTQLLTCQSNRFKDNSTNAATLTAYNTVAVKSFNPFQKNSGMSMYFDGAGDVVLTKPGPSNSLGSGDFTIEGWIYHSSLPSNARVLSQGTPTTGEHLLIIYAAGSADFCEATTARLSFPSGSFKLGQWQHFAIVRNGTGAGNMTAYINGVSVATATSTYNFNAVTSTYIGSNPNTGSQDFNGYLQDLRITKGVARYNAAFTPPTSPVQTK